MNKQLIFLLEEPSMKEFLRELLPRILPDTHEDFDWVLIPHNGKSDLESSIPKKLRVWQNPQARFVIVRDQDHGDCKAIKERLQNLAQNTHRPILVRIVCRMLEAWYFGDLSSVAQEYDTPNLTRLEQKKSYRIPDAIGNPADDLKKLVTDFGKTDAARRLGSKLKIVGNTSTSFSHFVQGVQRLWNLP
jgi:hypothetical protein